MTQKILAAHAGLSEVAPSRTNMYANDFSRMLMLTFSWNFDFGRKFKEANKKLWNSDEDSGIMR